VKNNLNQSKTNNESNFFTNNNDINIYLTKYIFNKKKTRNRENNIFFNKKTFNLSSQKYDMNGSINVINNTYLNNNTKNYIFNKNFFIKSRNKIPSCHKGRPNTIINKNKNLLVKKSKEKKKNSKDKKDLSKNLKSKRRNYSMIGYNNIININLNNINQNLTDRDNMINIKDNTMNKSPNHYSKNARHNKVLSGIYINLSNLGNIVKKEINSERNAKNNKNSYIRIMNQNQSNYTRPGAFLRHNAFYKAKQSFLSSHSVSKSKSNIKNNKKNKSNKNIKGNPNLQQKRNKSNFSNTLIDDLSKLKKISNKPKKINIENYKKGKKLSKDIGIDIFQKKIVGRNQKNSSNFGGGIIINNNEKITGALTSRTRNLKTYNIFFKTNSIDIDKIKIIDINNNKENCNTNRRQNNNNNNKINNSNNIMKKNFINLNDIIRSKKYQENHLKKISKITILKNNIEKASNDNNIYVPNGLRKISNENKNLIKYK